jgi:ketosteroid isomerase-like protein
MSRENADAVRAVYEDWGRGNFRAAVGLYDPLAVFIPIREFPGAASYYLGPDGVREFMLGFLEPWTNLTIAAEDVIEVGDSVLVAAHWRGAGKGSGALGERQVFDVWTFRGRAVIRLEFFSDRAEALEAVGLRE